MLLNHDKSNVNGPHTCSFIPSFNNDRKLEQICIIG